MLAERFSCRMGLRRYFALESARSTSATSQKPFSSSPASSLEKTRIRIEARKAPPNDASVTIDYSRNSAIADQSEVEVLKFPLHLIAHGRAICAAERASQPRTIDGSENTPLTPGLTWPTE